MNAVQFTVSADFQASSRTPQSNVKSAFARLAAVFVGRRPVFVLLKQIAVLIFQRHQSESFDVRLRQIAGQLFDHLLSFVQRALQPVQFVLQFIQFLRLGKKLIRIHLFTVESKE